MTPIERCQFDRLAASMAIDIFREQAVLCSAMLRHLRFVFIALSLPLILPSCDEPGVITPLDSPSSPIDPGFGERFFMGVLPVPSEGQSFEDSYRQAAEYAEFVPVWGRPTPFFEMASELSGTWGELFVEQYTRANWP